MCKYTNYQKLCDLLFACFALTWVVTRLGVYPTWILYSTTIEAPQIVEMFPAYYIFNGLLSILLVLHVIWTYFILKIIYKAMYSGKVINAVKNQCNVEINMYLTYLSSYGFFFLLLVYFLTVLESHSTSLILHYETFFSDFQILCFC